MIVAQTQFLVLVVIVLICYVLISNIFDDFSHSWDWYILSTYHIGLIRVCTPGEENVDPGRLY